MPLTGAHALARIESIGAVALRPQAVSIKLTAMTGHSRSLKGIGICTFYPSGFVWSGRAALAVTSAVA